MLKLLRTHKLLVARLLLVWLLLMPALLHAKAQPENAVTTIGYLFSDGNIPAVLSAYRQLIEQRQDLQGNVKLQLLTETTFSDMPTEALQSSDVLFYDVMNEQLLQRFNAERGIDLIAAIRARGGHVVGVGEGLQSADFYQQQGVIYEPKMRAYWEHSGPKNQLSLLQAGLSLAGVAGLMPADPELSLDFGFYYPDPQALNGRVFPDWEAFQNWRSAHDKLRPGKPRVAIGFFKASYYANDMALIDALIAEVERRGAEAIPVFGYPGAVAFRELLKDGNSLRADVGLGLFFQFNDTSSANLLEQLGIPVLNLVSLYGRNEAEWRNSTTGLSAFEGTFNLASPELAGTIAPTVVGTKERVQDPFSGLTSVITSPITSRVEMAVSRALRYANLRLKPNADKKIALIYYNYPPGKAGVSASYLNVAESLANVLQRLAEDGYDVGSAPRDADSLLAQMTTRARNIGSSAPGELQELVALNGVVRVPVEAYRGWLEGLAPSLKAKIVQDWGQPEDNPMMIEKLEDTANILVPGLQYGNILLMPQPSRGWGEDLEKLYHAKDLAPHHQYVAAYAWLRNGFAADGVVHVGTHGTLEWLDGRDTGLAEDDATDALIADLPNAYIYNVDVVGEGLVARRRSMATLVDHMVPPFIEGGLTEDLAALSGLLNDHIQNELKNPQLAATYARQARDLAIKLGISADLGLDSNLAWSDAQLHSVEDYLLELRSQIIPFGLHAFGRTPDTDAINSTVQAIVSVDRTALPDYKAAFGEDMHNRIVQSGPRELESLMKALSGQFVPAGKGGEPIRNPDAYPTGANFYGIDPDKIPKLAAWEMGTKLAQQMLDTHKAKHGRYPHKVSFVIWGDETMRHEGVLESQIFYLLGTKPVWNARGTLVDVEVIPQDQLGRPRVDIVIASASEGLFANLTRLMDSAVQKVKALEERDNYVRENFLRIRQALIAMGVAEDEADKMAGVRIFDEPPGQYNLNTSSIAARSGSWDSEAGMANEYLHKMGHGYGNGFWGKPMPDVFKMALSGVETVVHSNSTMLYGALDNDDMFMYMGGLSTAIKSLDGKAPELLLADTRDPGKPAMRSMGEFISREFRSRYVNPNWINGMQKEGYAGAGAMREFVEYLWGWDATVEDLVDDGMWQETYETYVMDKHEIGMKAYFEKSSPFAYQDITLRMIETIRKQKWSADEVVQRTLVREYLESVARHGANCTDISCGNARLLRHVIENAQQFGLPAPLVQQGREALERAMERDIESAASELEAFATRNDLRANEEREANRQLLANLPLLNLAQQAEQPMALATKVASVKQHAFAGLKKQSRSASNSGAESPAKPLDMNDVTQIRGQIMTEEVLVRKVDSKLQQQALPTLSTRDVVWPVIMYIILVLGLQRIELVKYFRRSIDHFAPMLFPVRKAKAYVKL